MMNEKTFTVLVISMIIILFAGMVCYGNARFECEKNDGILVAGAGGGYYCIKEVK